MKAVAFRNGERGGGEVLLQRCCQFVERLRLWVVRGDQIPEELEGWSSNQRQERRDLLVFLDAVRVQKLLETSGVSFPVIGACIERFIAANERGGHGRSVGCLSCARARGLIHKN